MIGKILRRMRKEKGMNQTELADMLNIDQTTLSGWERGYRQPTYEAIHTIADICGYTAYFENKETKERVTLTNIQRKDV